MGLRLFIFESLRYMFVVSFSIYKFQIHIRSALLCNATGFTWVYCHHRIVYRQLKHIVHICICIIWPKYPNRCAKFLVSQIYVGIVVLFVLAEMCDLCIADAKIYSVYDFVFVSFSLPPMPMCSSRCFI